MNVTGMEQQPSNAMHPCTHAPPSTEEHDSDGCTALSSHWIGAFNVCDDVEYLKWWQRALMEVWSSRALA